MVVKHSLHSVYSIYFIQCHKILANSLILIFKILVDSVYSERYMGQPDLSGNFRGYQESNIIQKFKNLQQRSNGTQRKVTYLHFVTNVTV